MFDDIKMINDHTVHSVRSTGGVVIEKPQIAEEIQKEKELRAAEEAKKAAEPPAQMPKPKKKKKKLSKKKRSKSWDEEAAKQEQLRRKNQERRRGSLAVRKDVVNKTLLRSMKRLIAQKFEADTGILNMAKDDQKSKFLELVDSFTRNYISKICEVSIIEDDEDESVIS